MILSGKVLIPVTSPPLTDASILIKGGKIAAVGPTEEFIKRYPGEEIRAYPHGMIIPGLINLHTHLEYTSLGPLREPTPFLSWLEDLIVRSKRVSEEDWKDSYRRGIEELKRCGVTTVLDIARRAVGLDDLIDSGLRALYCIEFVAVDDTILPSARKEFSNALINALRKTEGTKVQIGLAPHSLYTLSKNALSFVAKVAREKNLFLTIHLAESRAEPELIMHGRGPMRDFLSNFPLDTVPPNGFGISPTAYLLECGILHKRVVVSHGVWVDDKDLRLLQEKNAGIALCVRSNYFLKNGSAPLAKIKELKVHFGIGTDSLASNASVNPFEEIRLVKKQYREFSDEDLLRMVTIDSAEILGLSEITGSIQEGKKADLVVMNLISTVDSSQVCQYLVDEGGREDVLLSMVDGQVIFERGDA